MPSRKEISEAKALKDLARSEAKKLPKLAKHVALGLPKLAASIAKILLEKGAETKEADKAEIRGVIQYEVSVAIKEHVNGKIDVLSKKIDDYIIGDNQWKEDAQKYRIDKLEPIVETRARLGWLGSKTKMAATTIVLIASLIGATVIIKNYLLESLQPNQTIQK